MAFSPAFSAPVAALVYGPSSRGADTLLADFARDLLAQGRRLHGLVQHEIVPRGGGRPQRQLSDLRSGRLYGLSQDLGPGSRACSLDPGALAAASHVLRAALQARAELVIVNRFGAIEAAGGGFAQEMLALMSEGIPLVTVVSAVLLPDWRRFTGQAGLELPVARAPLQAWFEQLANGYAAAGQPDAAT
ncbi:DUF2478 domain-containing protein [Bordetella sp. BOR01]|uniref:DUF2478 domain-containing protein n=1 Tax=Bordetella sp. BOR01 TaxID=2854779 RepID=UPI001C43979C|nr:DUF2478 domain-containing protein [Bordetella sp. BOR01]MBV7481697.1 DUF2478 domain-containing protein [Bordetella sp. BOR01]